MIHLTQPSLKQITRRRTASSMSGKDESNRLICCQYKKQYE